MSARRMLMTLCAGLLLVALCWPAAGLADHITITATVSARLKERFSSRSWIVEVSWTAECHGAGPAGASYQGNLYLVDVDTGERTYMGGVSSATGKADQLVSVRATARHVKPELTISCFDNNTLHGSGTITATVSIEGGVVVVPAEDDDGEGGGGPGSGGSDPTAPVSRGGCKIAIQGTNRPDRLTGGSEGDIIFGYGAADQLRGAGGHDCLLGGTGNDTLRGEAGNDRLTGGSGRDVLVGGGGTNAYDAGRGNDIVNAANRRRELVRCGPGVDQARVDRGDRVKGCERVTRVG